MPSLEPSQSLLDLRWMENRKQKRPATGDVREHMTLRQADWLIQQVWEYEWLKLGERA